MKTKVYQFKIELNDIEPSIWRRFEVLSNITFKELHEVIQNVMGWTHTHLYDFQVGTFRIEEPHEEPLAEEHKTLESQDVKLNQILQDKEGTAFEYTYDFGDGWEHLLKLEKITGKGKGKRYPTCLEGERNCPPEDCGGSGGYEEFVKALKDREHKEHEIKKKWLGAHFDPERFNLEMINEALES